MAYTNKDMAIAGRQSAERIRPTGGVLDKLKQVTANPVIRVTAAALVLGGVVEGGINTATAITYNNNIANFNSSQFLAPDTTMPGNTEWIETPTGQLPIFKVTFGNRDNLSLPANTVFFGTTTDVNGHRIEVEIPAAEAAQWDYVFVEGPLVNNPIQTNAVDNVENPSINGDIHRAFTEGGVWAIPVVVQDGKIIPLDPTTGKADASGQIHSVAAGIVKVTAAINLNTAPTPEVAKVHTVAQTDTRPVEKTNYTPSFRRGQPAR